jgi:hypothetical protein
VDGEHHAIIEPDGDHPLARVSRFTGLKPEGFVPLEIQAERSRRWTSRTLVTATLLLAVFNAHAIQSWASTLAPNWATVTIRELADVWGARMGAAGLDAPRRGMRSAWEGAKAVTWKQVGGARVEVVQPTRK